MLQTIQITIAPQLAADAESHKLAVASALGCLPADLLGYHIEKQSLDARSRQALLHQTIVAAVGEPYHGREKISFQPVGIHDAEKPVVIAGAGPAGLFAALHLLEQGIKPIILERGKDVRQRRRDLALLNKSGILNPESNYCFGEGGAGTYSDGKLYTRSHKRGNIMRVLQLLHYFGADERILYEAHPHIGTNKLPHIIVSMREAIVAAGGEIRFDTRLTDIIIKNDSVAGVVTAQGYTIDCGQLVLATGHSARDIFYLLHAKGIAIEAKPFALGVRVEHPQEMIDAARYHCERRPEWLPPAAYSLVQQVGGKGVFSFCMCPGGIIAPAATSPNELVVNGWSPSRRNNPFANSGLVVEVSHADIVQEKGKLMHDMQLKASDLEGPLAFLHFQQWVERNCFAAGGGNFKAPAQRISDFVAGKASQTLPDCSYQPGVVPADLKTVLPAFVHERLREGLRIFNTKIKGYSSEAGIMVATESRTSSPVRVPRNPDTLEHIALKGLYPCAEGAGYAGGIVSAAMDGEKVAAQLAKMRA